MSMSPQSLIQMIDERINIQLTPEILSELAFKGISAHEARHRLRVRAVRALGRGDWAAENIDATGFVGEN